MVVSAHAQSLDKNSREGKKPQKGIELGQIWKLKMSRQEYVAPKVLPP